MNEFPKVDYSKTREQLGSEAKKIMSDFCASSIHEAIKEKEVVDMKYEYLKGSEKDFEGAPEWARLVVEHCEYKYNTWFYESDKAGGQWKQCKGQLRGIVERDGIGNWLNIIAERRPITDESDLNECIGQHTEIDGVASLIAERGKRYGKFSDGAEIMRDLKSVMHSTDGWERLSNSQQEALDMIQHKIGRVLNGDPNYDDNWKDIAGYATLVADELNDK